MIHLITEVSKYLMIFLFMFYTYYSFAVLVRQGDDFRERRMLRAQSACMFLLHLDAFIVLFGIEQEIRYLVFYVAQVLFVIFLFVIFKFAYKRASRLIVNHMCMLMMIGFIILARLDFDSAVRQFEIAAITSVVTIFIPLLVRKLKFLRKFTWVYAVVGILALGLVLGLGRMTGGAYISFTVGGITLQPSEFVKIIFVFFVACMLYKSTDFRQVCITTIVAAIHVLILVLSTDLGAALIFFITYVIMLYVATRRPAYVAAGAGVGVVAALAANRLFSHVHTRVAAWRDPFANIDGGGWQVAQSLFAIGTGGWFGLGLCQGLPNTIPVASSDFVFAAIVEEMGILFGICLILVCFSCFMMFLNIAMQIRDQFYKLIALGLGCVYGIQVFLNIGGVIKLIPSTGLTLPLVSYGGSSIFCTMIMFAIIQGLYIMRQDEGESDEPEQPVQQEQKKKEQQTAPRRSRDHGSGRENDGGVWEPDENVRKPDENDWEPDEYDWVSDEYDWKPDQSVFGEPDGNVRKPDKPKSGKQSRPEGSESDTEEDFDEVW
ncbi:MAG: FtsW/RodA/SpoVE family cell cycle protein [Lachnospiraceae bacterium]|nr:FtsW/RodA/SpoVE family cell cycle protein [Lachnospiraceae bacterium]